MRRRGPCGGTPTAPRRRRPLCGDTEGGERRAGGSWGKVFLLGRWIESSVQALDLGDSPPPAPSSSCAGAAGCVALALLPPDSGQSQVSHRSLSCRPQPQPCCPVSHGGPDHLRHLEGPPVTLVRSAISCESRELPGPCAREFRERYDLHSASLGAPPASPHRHFQMPRE